MDWIQQWQSKLNKQNGVAPLVRTGGSRHTGLAALPYRNIQNLLSCTANVDFSGHSGHSRNSICSRHVLCRSDRDSTGRDEGFSGGLCTFIE